MKRRIFSVLLPFLFLRCAMAQVEFFFITTPSVLPDTINRLVQTLPLAGVGHGALYVSSACRDESGAKNLFRGTNKGIR